MKKIIKNLINKGNKPLFGNNRSFSMRATRRKFSKNLQTLRIGAKTYRLPVKTLRTLWKLKKKSLI